MRLAGLDHYPDSVNYAEHLLVKVTGLPVEFRYIRRYLNRHGISFKAVHSPFKVDYKWVNGKRVEGKIPTADPMISSTFAFRIFGSKEFLAGLEFKIHRDDLMLLKLASN